MTREIEEAAVNLTLSTNELGALLGCLGSASERSYDDGQKVVFMDLADRLRDAQRDMLGPMSVAEGMRLVKEVQDVERATVVQLR